MVYIKGAAEVLFEKCSNMMDAGGSRVACSRDRLQSAMEEMAANGLRVLAFARLDLRDAEAISFDQIQGLTLLGLQGMIDPPRPEAIAAVRTSQEPESL